MQKVLGENAKIIVSYPQAISERLVSTKQFSSKIKRIKRGDSLDLDNFIDQLDEYGFERVPQVYDAGQFSLRGGIVDVYSFSSQRPFRIEFFGDEVESIRTFDIASQLSIEQKEKVSILAGDSATESIKTKVAFPDYLPENTVIWIEDRETCLTEIERLEMYNCEGESLFASHKEMESWLNACNCVDILPNSVGNVSRYNKVMELSCEPQMQFNSRFDMLIAELEKRFEQSYECFFSVCDYIQKLRIEKILEEFTPKENVL